MKSADEMLQDLGFHGEHLTGVNESWYRKGTEEGRVTIKVDFDIKYVDCKIGRDCVPMEFGEVLAVARLIEEREGKK